MCLCILRLLYSVIHVHVVYERVNFLSSLFTLCYFFLSFFLYLKMVLYARDCSCICPCVYVYVYGVVLHCRTSLIAGATALIGKSGSAEWTTQTQTTPPASFHRYRLSVSCRISEKGGGGKGRGSTHSPP